MTTEGLPDLPDHDALIARLRPHREKWATSPKPDVIDVPGPGQESVWDFPRPPLVRPTAGVAEVRCGERLIARSEGALNIVETAGAPVHYFPPSDVRTQWLRPTDHVTFCEWKGAGVHFDLVTPEVRVEHAAFAYPDPLDDLGRGYPRVAGWFGFYPAKLACFLDGERVAPQPGGVYAGWVTPDLTGPIKGAPGTGGW